MSRKYEIVLYGASGFTGKLVCEYLLKKYQRNELRWAIAGRDIQKLKEVRRELNCEQIPIVEANSNDLESLKKMANQTDVMLSVVGPYSLYGSHLIEACIREKTDYCDLSGEVHWMRKMMDRWQKEAVGAGVRLVHSCGFDSVPSDLGVLYLQNWAEKELGHPLKNISMRVNKIKGGVSGGTIASMFNIRREAEKDRSIYRVIMRRYSLNPDPEWGGPDERDLRTVKWDHVAESWISPFIMGTINTRIVRRTQALMNYPNGRDFTYDEAIDCGKGISGKIKGWLKVLPLGLIRAAKPGTLLYKAVRYFLPAPGQGPSREKIQSGSFELWFYGWNPQDEVYYFRLSGKRDPGYGATARMLAESGVCMVKDQNKTPDLSGFLTPASAMGESLIKRLEEHADIRFSDVQIISPSKGRDGNGRPHG